MNCFAKWLLLFFVSQVIFAASAAPAENWQGWRGPTGDGHSGEKNIPTTWDGKTGKNIIWKVKVPGRSHSSPIVWQDKIFLVTCIEENQQRELLCLDRETGKTLWSKTVIRAPLERKHKLNSYASGTPVTDGGLVYVTFLEPDDKGEGRLSPGNMLVAAYDFEGNQKWLVRTGRFSSMHGYCSSPVLYKDKIIVNGDHDGDSYIVALDRASGKTLWKTARENKTRSYVTPIIRKIDGRTQMILSGDKGIASYNPESGKRHWQIRGPTEQYVASMVYNGKLLFMTAGFPEKHIMAIRPDGSGDITKTHVVWHERHGCSYVPSPIVLGEYFLVVSDGGVATCFDSATGKKHWTQRMGRRFSASLVTAGGNVYFTSDDGETTVVRAGGDFKQVAKNVLGEHTYASPAISAGQIFIRGEAHLFCIGKKK